MRLFHYEDNYMLQKAQVMLNSFINKKSEFVNAFPGLADPFAANLQTKIDDADAIPSDDEYNSGIIVLIGEGNTAIAAAKKKLQVLFNYADVAFDSKAKLDTFGKGLYKKVYENRGKMIDLINMAVTNAELAENASILAAAGYPLSNNADLSALRTQLIELNDKIANAKEGRKMATKTRIDAMNAVWLDLRKINKASKVIFANSPADLKTFQLFKKKKSNK